MSWTQVDFSSVRFSHVEDTYYFFDAAHPTAIQFLLNGQWESWDVGFVKHKTQDPEVKRIAEDAEARLVDDRGSGYTQWPSESPPGAGIHRHAPPLSDVESPLRSPEGFEHPNSAARDDSDRGHPINSPGPFPEPHEFRYPAPVPPDRQAQHGASYGTAQAEPAPTAVSNASTFAAAAPIIVPSPTHFPSIAHLPRIDTGLQHAHAPLQAEAQPTTAPSIVLSRNRETKILLSLDGDGVRGLSQVLIVESIVNAVCTKIGAQIDPYQIFDLIGGSSLGGVLAILLSRLRMQAHRAREAYKLISKEVFPNKRDFFTSFDPNAPPVTHNGQAVTNAITTVVVGEVGNADELLLDSRDDSADVFVVSTRIDIGTNKAALMRSFQTRRITGPELDVNISILQAMRATSIAPRYMQPRDGVNWRPVIEPGLVDHGTAKNNPIRDILYECRKLYRYANDMMVIVSIGTGVGFDPGREVPEMTKSVNDRTLEAGVWGEKFETDHRALMDRGWMKYFRFNVPGLHDVPLEEWCHEDKIKERTLAYLGRPDVGQMFYACVDAITAILLGGPHVTR